MMFWYVVMALGAASALAAALSMASIIRLRSKRAGRRLFLALLFLFLSAITELLAAAYWALRGYGAEIALPSLAAAVFLALSAISLYEFVSI